MLLVAMVVLAGVTLSGCAELLMVTGGLMTAPCGQPVMATPIVIGGGGRCLQQPLMGQIGGYGYGGQNVQRSYSSGPGYSNSSYSVSGPGGSYSQQISSGSRGTTVRTSQNQNGPWGSSSRTVTSGPNGTTVRQSSTSRYR